MASESAQPRPEDYEVRCSKCKVSFECRTNLLNGQPTWFPKCKHDSAWAEVFLTPEAMTR